jgi:hypothetical protein
MHERKNAKILVFESFPPDHFRLQSGSSWLSGSPGSVSGFSMPEFLFKKSCFVIFFRRGELKFTKKVFFKILHRIHPKSFFAAGIHRKSFSVDGIHQKKFFAAGIHPRSFILS